MKAGWEVKPLGEVCELVNGKAYKKAELLDKGKYPVLRVGNFFTSNKWFHSNLELEPKKYCETGDLLYAWSASFGPRIWEGKKSIFHYHIWNVRHPTDQLDRKFLYYYFDWDKEKIKAEQGAGATMIHVSKGSMEARALPIPPLEEQKQIVAVLDAAFEGLTRATVHAEANLQNARELFDQAVEQIFAKLVAVNATGRLEEVTSKITKGSSPKWQGFSYVDSPGVLFVTSENVGKNVLLLEKTKYVEEAFNLKDKKSILAPGDVLTNIVGASIGRTAVFEIDAVANINQAVCLMRCLADRLAPKFLSFLLNSPYFKARLHDGESNMARANLSLSFFKEFMVPLPSLEIQTKTVAEIEALADYSTACEVNFRTKLADIADLRKSLLQKAFAGELTS